MSESGNISPKKVVRECECGANRIVEPPGFSSGAYPCRCPGRTAKWKLAPRPVPYHGDPGDETRSGT